MPRHGENIDKRKDGRYEGRYVIGRTGSGRTRFGYVYGYQYSSVRSHLLHKKAQLLNNQGVDDPPGMTVQRWMTRWLEADDVRGMMTAMQSRGLSTAMERAVEDHIIGRNPCKKIRLMHPQTEQRVLSRIRSPFSPDNFLCFDPSSWFLRINAV